MPEKLPNVTVPALTVPSVIVPPAPPFPIMASSGVLLFQVALAAPSHQRSAVSHVPAPSLGLGPVVPLESQVRLAACAVARARERKQTKETRNLKYET